MSACGVHRFAPAVPAHFPARFVVSRDVPSWSYLFDMAEIWLSVSVA